MSQLSEDEGSLSGDENDVRVPRFLSKPDAWRKYINTRVIDPIDWNEFRDTIIQENVRQQALLIGLSRLVNKYMIGSPDFLKDMVAVQGSFFYDYEIVITEGNIGTFTTTLVTYCKNALEPVRGSQRSLGGSRFLRPTNQITDASRTFEVAHALTPSTVAGELEKGTTNFISGDGTILVPFGISGESWIENTNGVKVKTREENRATQCRYVTLGPRLLETVEESDRKYHRVDFENLGPELISKDIPVPGEIIRNFINDVQQMCQAFAAFKDIYKANKAQTRPSRAPRNTRRGQEQQEKQVQTSMKQMQAQLLGTLRQIRSSKDGILGKLNTRVSKGTQTTTGVIQANATNNRARRQAGPNNHSASHVIKGIVGSIRRIQEIYKNGTDTQPSGIAGIKTTTSGIFSNIARMERGVSNSEIANYKRALVTTVRNIIKKEVLSAYTPEQMDERMRELHSYGNSIGLKASSSIYNYSITPQFLAMIPILSDGFYEPWMHRNTLERISLLTTDINRWQAGKMFTDTIRYQTPHEVTRKLMTSFISNRPTPGVLSVMMGLQGDFDYDNRPGFNSTAAWTKVFGQLPVGTKTRLVVQSDYFIPLKAAPRPNTMSTRNENTGPSVLQMGASAFGLTGTLLNPNELVVKTEFGEELLKKLETNLKNNMGLMYSSIWDYYDEEGTLITAPGLPVPAYNYDQIGFLAHIDINLSPEGYVRSALHSGWRVHNKEFTTILREIGDPKVKLGSKHKFLLRDQFPSYLIKQENERRITTEASISDWKHILYREYKSIQEVVVMENRYSSNGQNWSSYTINNDEPDWYSRTEQDQQGTEDNIVDVDSQGEGSGDDERMSTH